MNRIKIDTVEKFLEVFRSLNEDNFSHYKRAVDPASFTPQLMFVMKDGTEYTYSLNLAQEVKKANVLTYEDAQQEKLLNRLDEKNRPSWLDFSEKMFW
jgi:hypothetical protein